MGCSNKNESIKIGDKTSDTLEFANKSIEKTGNKGRFYDTILDIDKSVFRVFQDTTLNPQFMFRVLKQVNGNWQTNIDEGWTSVYEFKDWNKDGFTDIVLRYHHAFVIILYNPKKQKFVKFGDVGELTDTIEHIEGTSLMCNLDEHKSWNSELFDIDPNFNKRSYGIMVNWDESREDNDLDNPIICVYKRLLIYNEDYDNQSDTTIFGTNKMLIDKIETSKTAYYHTPDIEKYDSLRMDFVKKYWIKNWRKFTLR
jgi:hypothetical protein